MGIAVESVRTWQWALIGLGGGLLLGSAFNAVNRAGGMEPARTIDPRAFQRALDAPPLRGHPWLADLRVHRIDGRDVLTLKQLMVDPRDPHPSNARRYRYMPARLSGGPPFLPVGDPSQTVEVTIDPAARWPDGLRVNGEPRFDADARIQLDHWRIEAGGADPGTGAKLNLVLRPANYQMTLVLDRSAPAVPPSGNPGISVKLNGRAVDPLSRTSSPLGPAWTATLPASAFVPGPWQAFEFSRTGTPARIHRIMLRDPNYTIVDYLQAARVTHPQFAWKTAWWDNAPLMLAVFSVGGVVLVGGVWPVVLRRLIGAGYGRMIPDAAYDLDRFAGDSAVAPASTNEIGSDDELLALGRRMEEALTADAASHAPAAAAEPSAPAIATLPGTSTPAPRPETAEPEPTRKYEGEYYPVVRAVGSPPHDAQHE